MKPTERIGESPEWRLLLECAGAPVSGTVPELLASCDGAMLAELAEEHGVINLLARHLQQSWESAPTELASNLQERQRQNAITALSLIAEMLRVTEWLNAAGIETLVLKGPALSLQAYGDPALRQYGDIDLLARSRDVYRATELLRKSGYQARIPLEAIAAGRIPGEYAFRRGNGTLLEIHTERTLRYFPNPLQVEELFTRKAELELNGKKFHTQSLEDALLAACTHGAKHFWSRLLWVADVAALLRCHGERVDWDRTLKSAHELGAERILRTGLLLAKDTLHAAVPAEIAPGARRDCTAIKIARQLAQTLPYGAESEPPLLKRAIFRMRIKGGGLAGLGYLARLSLSPTEQDWEPRRTGGPGRVRESSRRLWRLAAKYGRNISEK